MKAKVIKNEVDYQATLAYVAMLMDAAPGSREEEELELFSLLVEQYELEHYPIAAPDPVEAILFRMEQEGLTRKDLAAYRDALVKIADAVDAGVRAGKSLSEVQAMRPADAFIQPKGAPLTPDQFVATAYEGAKRTSSTP